ncbi:hypothetical protein MBM_07268 [Drepanopeziza brunnea f. sp. 'multigermtubi' MB_m1]|uniref:Uncharacterized protein n=1 Tax=Marssonina brunnea f. sp. multigermtubi (strain MB_m1) TaxID=1072389 RepID=K1WQ85_MARBU|nr:uncharacterized protein MBM_07268 [Drepanopeziza brunnea f. sp. 'multigermtubi' MB_m1]EKD14547.1 hypothetical protein MBM_07268 [Drepanopeziza brunnea f. sp. 'multigermtubi' MB_m1]
MRANKAQAISITYSLIHQESNLQCRVSNHFSRSHKVSPTSGTDLPFPLQNTTTQYPSTSPTANNQPSHSTNMSFTNEQTSPKADPSSAAPSRSQQLNAFLFQLASAYASKDPVSTPDYFFLLPISPHPIPSHTPPHTQHSKPDQPPPCWPTPTPSKPPPPDPTNRFPPQTTIQAAQALLFGGLQIETKISEQRIAVQDYAAFAELFNKMFAVTAVINKRKTEIVSSAELKMPAMAGYCSGCGDCDESKEKGASESR